eukprot:TRINITY_DN2711_c0_g3_i1.p1 TRINITY_DN2711_c0_g3~~TRINITY_DN2711_c0_g3_i1.p1  ORF type:complete len:715 (-),score=121.29 TRINITY_DN2711_c0_g3_i1:54-2198(-)
MPHRISDNKIIYQNRIYTSYIYGKYGWLSKLFEPLLSEGMYWGEGRTLQEDPDLWICDYAITRTKKTKNLRNSMGGEKGLFTKIRDSEPFAWMIMHAEAEGDFSATIGHPGQFFEVRILEERQVIEVYQIVEVGRRNLRSLVFSSDAYHSHQYLNRKLVNRHKPLMPQAERVGGNMFGGLFTDVGCLVPRPGAGNMQDDPVGSLVITRKSLLSDGDSLSSSTASLGASSDMIVGCSGGDGGSDWEEYVPETWLQGLIPSVFLDEDGLHFWKRSDHTIVGYPTKKTRTELSKYLLNIKPTSSTTGDSLQGQALISAQMINPREETQARPLYLMNLLEASEDTPLGVLAKLVERVETLSHVLVWSYSNAKVGEHAEISFIEFVRLNLRFTLGYDSEENPRFYSLDHDGLFISQTQSLSWTETLPHSLVLEDRFKQLFLLVPRYMMQRPEIIACPFSTSLISQHSDKSGTTGYYLYPVHLSQALLKTPSLASALYLFGIFLLRRKYTLAAQALSWCYTDLPYSQEELRNLSLVNETSMDTHPDAVACRLRLALITLESSTTTVFEIDLNTEYVQYHSRRSHVSLPCRLTLEEEEALLKIAHHPFYTVMSVYFEKVRNVREGKSDAENFFLELPTSPLRGGYDVAMMYARNTPVESFWGQYRYTRPDKSVLTNPYSALIPLLPIKTVIILMDGTRKRMNSKFLGGERSERMRIIFFIS